MKTKGRRQSKNVLDVRKPPPDPFGPALNRMIFRWRSIRPDDVLDVGGKAGVKIKKKK